MPRKHTWNVLGIALSVFVFAVGLWQLDLLCAPLIWRQDFIFYWPFNLAWSAQLSYCLMHAMIMGGLAGVFLALWLWTD